MDHKEHVENLNELGEKYPDEVIAIKEITQHLLNARRGYYNDDNKPIETRKMLIDVSDSKNFNIASYQVLKYLQRYITSGFDKSKNKLDLKKAAHYLIYELIKYQRDENYGKL